MNGDINEYEYNNYEYDNNINFSLRYRDKIKLKKELKNDKYTNIFNTYNKTSLITDIEKKYNSDIVNILIFVNPKYLNNVNEKYFKPNNFINLIENFNLFDYKKILSIINYLLLNYQEEIKHIVLNIFVFLYTINKKLIYKQAGIIDYIIYFLDIVDEFKQKVKIQYNQLDKIKFNLEKLYDSKCNLNIKLELYIYLNTDSSLIIDWIIDNYDYQYILKNLEKCLKQKTKIIIKETDIIKILKLFIKTDNTINKNIWTLTKIPELLLENDYFIALKLFENYFKNNEDFLKIFASKIINLIIEFDKLKLNILLEDHFIFDLIISNKYIGHFLMTNDKYIDYFISKGFKLLYKNFNLLIDENFNLRRFKRRLKKNKNIFKQDISLSKKNFFNNLIKLDIPLNNKIIVNFLEYIEFDKIIDYYKKRADVDSIIPFLIKNNNYEFLDKLISNNIITLEHYKKNFSTYIKNINCSYSRYYNYTKNKILSIYKYNQKKYSVISFGKFFNLYIQTLNVNKLKYVFKLYNITKKIFNPNTIFNKIYNIYDKYYYYHCDSMITILEYLKPFIKNYNKIFDSLDNIDKIIEYSRTISLNEIKKIREYNKNFKLNLDFIKDYGIRNKDKDQDNYIGMVEYIIEEFNKMNKTEQDNIYTMYQNFLNNFIIDFNFSTCNNDKINNLLDSSIILKNMFNQSNIYNLFYYNTELISNNIYFFEKHNLFTFDLYTNTFFICCIEYNSHFDLIKYAFKKTPYVKYKTYNYIKCMGEYFKNKVVCDKGNYYRNSTKYDISLYLLYSSIANSIKAENIIYPDNPIYNSNTNVPIDIQNIKNYLTEYLFENIVLTDDNNILDEL